MVLIIILLSGILVFNIWNLFSLSNLRKYQSTQQTLNDPKYYEIKAKQDFMIAVFTVFAATATFIGINSIKSIEENIKGDLDFKLKGYQEKMETLSGVLKTTDSTVQTYPLKFNNYDKLLQYLENKQNQIKQSTSVSGEQAKSILKRIQELNNKNILKQETYVVQDVVYDESKVDSNSFQTFYFKDLRTILGDKLPKFEKHPFIMVVSNEGASIQIINVTKESFQLGIPSYLSLGPSKSENKKYIGRFYLLVSEIP